MLFVCKTRKLMQPPRPAWKLYLSGSPVKTRNSKKPCKAPTNSLQNSKKPHHTPTNPGGRIGSFYMLQKCFVLHAAQNITH